MQAPQARHCFRVDQLEDTLLAVCPLDKTRAVLSILEEFQEELPEVGGGALARFALDAGGWGPVGAWPLLGLELVVIGLARVVAKVEHGVGQLVMWQRRWRGCREVVCAAASVPVPVGFTLADSAYWNKRLLLIFC